MKAKISFASPLAIVITILLTGTASALTAYWFKTSVSDSVQGDIVSISVKDCASLPASDAKAVQVQLPALYSFDASYQIIDHAQITPSQIKKAALAMCEQRSIAAAINAQFPDMQEFSAQRLAPNSKGLYFPLYLEGTVTAVNGKQVSISNLGSNTASPTSVTMQLADDALLTKEGQQIASLHPGDHIFFAYQNRAQAGVTPDQCDLSSVRQTSDPGVLSVVRGAGVMTTDPSAIQQLKEALTSGAVRELQGDPLRG